MRSVWIYSRVRLFKTLGSGANLLEIDLKPTCIQRCTLRFLINCQHLSSVCPGSLNELSALLRKLLFARKCLAGCVSTESIRRGPTGNIRLEAGSCDWVCPSQWALAGLQPAFAAPRLQETGIFPSPYIKLCSTGILQYVEILPTRQFVNGAVYKLTHSDQH